MSTYLRYLCRGLPVFFVLIVGTVLLMRRAAVPPAFSVGLAAAQALVPGLYALRYRAKAFELALPLAASTLVWSRVAVYTAFGWACIWLPALVFLAWHPWDSVLPTALWLTPVVPALLTLGYAVPPYRNRIGDEWVLVLVLGAGLGSVPLTIWKPGVFVPVLCAVTLVSAWTLRTRLPPSLELAYHARKPGHASLPQPVGPCWFAFRHGVLRLPVVFIPALLALFGRMPGGGLVIAICGWGTLEPFVVSVRERLRILRMLPVAPRTVCPFVVLPPLGLLFAGVALSAALPRSSLPAPADGIDWNIGVVETGYAHWRFGRGPDPVEHGPNGEAFRLPHARVPGTPFFVYDPFATGRKSSPEFVRHQLRRGVRAIYGRKVDPGIWFRDRWFDEGAFALARRGWALPGRSGRTQATVLLLVGLWFLTVRPLFPGMTVHRRRFPIAGCALGCVFVLLPLLAWLTDVVPAQGLTTLLDVCTRRVHAALASWTAGAAGWGAAVAAFAVAYWRIDRRFAGAEDAYVGRALSYRNALRELAE